MVLKSNSINILITAVGSANGINTISALKRIKEKNIRLIGIDANPLSAGIQLVDTGYVVPKITDEKNYFRAIEKIIKSESINVVIPIFSKEIPIYASYKEIFKEKYAIDLCIPSIDLINKMNDKFNFFNYIMSIGFKTPRTCLLNDFTSQENLYSFPYMIKKRVSAGSKSIFKINNSMEFDETIKLLKSESEKLEDYIVQEFLTGNEYTIDFCCDFHARFLGAVIRERLEVRDGKSTKGVTVYDEKILAQVKELLENCGYIGPGNLQGFISEGGEFYFTELNPRFAAGGLPLTVDVGFNIPWIITQLVLNPKEKFDVFSNYPNGHVMLRYFTEVFTDLESSE